MFPYRLTKCREPRRYTAFEGDNTVAKNVFKSTKSNQDPPHLITLVKVFGEDIIITFSQSRHAKTDT
ncbi:unnamed protein product [Arabidopsis thaliana]|uniref:Uncharacterized protein n=1 Tax=Arabidopsis thaliana TaxID=3702 RepID=A0A5S9WYD9_ARATH|nr:unnamed protein product [Arabidopsis thaliana]